MSKSSSVSSQYETYIPQEWSHLSSSVVRTSRTHVARIACFGWSQLEPGDQSAFVDPLKKEYEITKRAYEQGLSVPFSLGVFNLQVGAVVENVNSTLPLPISPQTPAFIRRYVPGIVVKDLSGQELDEAWKKYGMEAQKAESLGFIVSDFYSGNVIWQPKRRRVVLIDLEMWDFQK